MAFMRAAEPRLVYSLGFTIALSLVGCGNPSITTPAGVVGVPSSESSASGRKSTADPARTLVERGLLKVPGARRILDLTLDRETERSAARIAFKAVLVVTEYYPRARVPNRDVQENWEGSLDLANGTWKGRYLGSVAGNPDDLPGPGRWIVIPLGATK